MPGDQIYLLPSAIDDTNLELVNQILTEHPESVLMSVKGSKYLSLGKSFSVVELKKAEYERTPSAENRESLKNSTRISNLLLSATLTYTIGSDDVDEQDIGWEILAWLSSINKNLCFKKLQNGLTPLEYAESRELDEITETLERLKPTQLLSQGCTLFRPVSPSDWGPDAFIPGNDFSPR